MFMLLFNKLWITGNANWISLFGFHVYLHHLYVHTILRIFSWNGLVHSNGMVLGWKPYASRWNHVTDGQTALIWSLRGGTHEYLSCRISRLLFPHGRLWISRKQFHMSKELNITLHRVTNVGFHMGLLPHMPNCGLAMRREYRERFPLRRLARKLPS